MTTPVGNNDAASDDQIFAADPSKLSALRDAVTAAGGIGAGLWLSYVLVLFYFLIAAGGISHKDLLLENPVKLPCTFMCSYIWCCWPTKSALSITP